MYSNALAIVSSVSAWPVLDWDWLGSKSDSKNLALTMTKGRWERRFKNYRDNVNAWERELTDAVGLTVYVRSLHPALGPKVPAAVKECSIKLWRRGR